MLRQFNELFRKELKILLRDRQTILLLFFMPAALIFFLSLAGAWITTGFLNPARCRR